jgi:hypothetical protein
MSDNGSVDLAPLTDDPQASNTSRNSTVPAQHLRNRYNFVYPAFPPGSKVPRFKDHLFWRALSSSDGRTLAKLAVVICHPKSDFDCQTTLAILAAGLPSFVRPLFHCSPLPYHAHSAPSVSRCPPWTPRSQFLPTSLSPCLVSTT